MMCLIQLIILSIGLSMDAFAASITLGIKNNNKLIKRSFSVGGCFGLFQGLMLFLGYKIGTYFNNDIAKIDHYIVFAILLFIGLKMFIESFNKEESKDCALIVLGILTSIDALSVGVSLFLLNVNIILASLLVGIITLILCFIGVIIGNICKEKYRNKAEIIGSLIIIIIAFKILIENIL